MPNHVRTLIRAEKHVIDALYNSEGEVGFGQIVPFPEELDGITAEVKVFYTQEEVDEYQKKMEDTYANLPAIFRNGDEKSIHALHIERATALRAAHGAIHWYDWNTSHWGTKWDAYEVDRKDDQNLAFDTAWAHPEPVLIALSRRFPEEQIAVAFADEDLGYNVGIYIIKDGARIHNPYIEAGTEDAEEFAAQVKYGMSRAEYYANNYSGEELEDMGIEAPESESTTKSKTDAFDTLKSKEITA